MHNRALFVIFGTLLLDMIGTGMVFPIIPILFTDPSSPAFMLHGYSQAAQYFVAGLITALFGLMQFIAAPLLGELSDVFGRKRLLLLGVGTLAAAQALFGFGIEVQSLTILLVSRTIAGLAGANISIAQAAVADITRPEDRAKNFGLIGAAFGVGFILGPVLSGWIASYTHNAAAPFWFASILGIVNLVFVSIMLPETRRVAAEVRRRFNLLRGFHNIKQAFLDVQARAIYLASFLYLAGFTFLTAFMGVLLVVRFGFDAAAVGTFFGVVGLWVVLTQLLLVRFITRFYDEKAILRVSLLILAFGICIYPFLPNTLFIFAMIPFVAVPQGLSMVNMQSLISKSVSADKQGAALGINASLLALSQGVIPLVAGFGSGVIGLQSPFILGAILVVFAWYVLFASPLRVRNLARG
jgi:DHA1 family tetracycline resistance protein-like MFS transporter